MDEHAEDNGKDQNPGGDETNDEESWLEHFLSEEALEETKSTEDDDEDQLVVFNESSKDSEREEWAGVLSGAFDNESDFIFTRLSSSGVSNRDLVDGEDVLRSVGLASQD